MVDAGQGSMSQGAEGLPPGQRVAWAALSKTSSHPPRWRSAASTAARTSAAGAPGDTQPSAVPNAANWSPMSAACSASIHQPSA
jgi:hypothetical protein